MSMYLNLGALGAGPALNKKGEGVAQEGSATGKSDEFGEQRLKESCDGLGGAGSPELVERFLAGSRNSHCRTENWRVKVTSKT